MGEMSAYSTEGPMCPFCHRQFTADEPIYYDESNFTQMECDECSKSFAVRVRNETSWTTEAKVPGNA